MAVENLTDEQLAGRLYMLEARITRCTDPKDLPYLNDTFSRLLNELVRRDLLRGDAREKESNNDFVS